MQTPLDENVIRHFREQRQKIDGVPAVIGRLGAEGVVDVSQDPRVDSNPNRLYALIAGNRAETAVWNTGKFIVNWRYPGMNVRVALNAEGEWEIIAGDARAADRALGRGAGQVLSPAQVIPELNQTPVPGRNFLPGRVRPWVSGTLEVNAERFLYTDTAGDEQEYLPTNANTLDLAGDVPAASGGVNQHRYVKIAFDPDATTPVLDSFPGTPQLITMPLATDGYTAIAVTDGFIQLDTVILTTGDADETDIPEGDWRYTRRVQETDVPSSSLPNFGTGATKTLASGVATAGSDRHLILAAESSTTDDLIEVSGLSVGDAVLLRADSGDTITVKHNDAGATDKIILDGAADVALSGDKLLLLVKTASGKVVQPVDEQSSGSSTAPDFDEDSTTESSIADTSATVGANSASIVFTAPASGSVFITVSGHISIGNNTHRIALGWALREGNSVGSGTVVQAADTDYSVITGRAVNTGAQAEVSADRRKLVTGLTGGNEYNVQTLRWVTGGAGEIYYRALLVEYV